MYNSIFNKLFHIPLSEISREDTGDISDILSDTNSSMTEDKVRGPNNVGNLFHMAGEVGKEVGRLVTVMTDENAAETEVAVTTNGN